jgi:uncharacterized integral membrane protein
MPMKEDPSDVAIALSLVAGALLFVALMMVKLVRLLFGRALSKVHKKVATS